MVDDLLVQLVFQLFTDFNRTLHVFTLENRVRRVVVIGFRSIVSVISDHHLDDAFNVRFGYVP